MNEMNCFCLNLGFNRKIKTDLSLWHATLGKVRFVCKSLAAFVAGILLYRRVIDNCKPEMNVMLEVLLN